MQRRLRSQKERGLTLLELVIAVFILAIGSIAALRATDQSRRGIGEDIARQMALQAAQNRIQELRLYGMSRGLALPDQVTLGGMPVTIEMTRKRTQAGLTEATVRAISKLGPGVVLVTYLTDRQR